MSNSANNWFDWFGLDPAFQLDLAALRGRYLELQRELHPDAAIARGESNAAAVQANSRLNDAWDTLRDPVKRAIYLLQLNGHTYDPDRQTQQDVSYLMEQMELREQLADLAEGSDEAQTRLDALRDRADHDLAVWSEAFEAAWKSQDLETASSAIGRMMFAQKLERDIDNREEELFD